MGSGRRGWIVIGLLAAVLFGYVLTHRVPSEQYRRIPTAPETTPTARLRLEGTVGPGPKGLRLFVGDQEPHLVDGATGASTPLSVPGSGKGDLIRLRRAGDHLVAFVPERPPRQVAYLVRPGKPAIRLGPAENVIATTDGGLLISRLDGDLSTLTAYSAAGVVRWTWTASRVQVVPVVDTAYGLLVHEVFDRDQNLGPLKLVDRVTGRVRREVARSVTLVLAADTRRVAWIGPGTCRTVCPVKLGELAGPRTTEAPNRFGRDPYPGVFSADGTTLVLPMPGLSPGSRGAYPSAFVASIDVATGSLGVLPGFAGPPGATPTVDRYGCCELLLFVPFPDDDRVRVAGVTPGGTSRPTILPWTFPTTATIGVAP